MQPDRPLLTIAIPTYNRQQYLTDLLSVLEPQLAAHPEVELLVANNASPDGTTDLVQGFIARGMKIRYHRHPENVGSDANFIYCLTASQGKYFWLCGDDDIILPGTVDEVTSHLAREEFDLVYVTSYGFKNDFIAERKYDPLGRRFHRITSAHRFTKAVNIMLTFISGIIVNKDRLEAIPHPDPRDFVHSNLIQLSWILPLLQHHRRSLILWDRPLAGRQGNAGGYAVGQVFGKNLIEVARRCLPQQPGLVAILANFTACRWLPENLFELRRDNNQKLSLESARDDLWQAYRRNPCYWIFAYPVLVLPLPLAALWSRASVIINKVIYMVIMPEFWRKEI